MAEPLIFQVALEDSMSPVLARIVELLENISETMTAVSSSITDGFTAASAASENLYSAMVANNAMLDDLVGTSEAAAEGMTILDESINTVAVSTDATTTAIAAQNEALASNIAVDEEAAAANETYTTSVNAAGEATYLARHLVLAGVLGLAVFGKQALDTALDYQNAMINIQSMTGQTAAQMNDIGAAIQRYSTEYATAPTKVADAFYYLLSASIKTSDAITIMNTVLQASQGAMLDQAVYANLLSTALTAYQLSASQASSVSDILLEMIVQGKVEADQLEASFGRMVSGAKTAGVSLQEMAAALDTLSLFGFTAGNAETLLGSVFETVMDKASQFSDRAAKLGIAFNENAFAAMDFKDRLEYLMQIVTNGGPVTDEAKQKFINLFASVKYGTVAMDLVQDKGVIFESMLKGIGNSAGLTQSSFDNFRTSLQFAFNSIGAAAGRLVVQLSSDFGPQLLGLFHGVANAVDMITKAFQTHGPEIEAVLKGLGIVLGALVLPMVVGIAEKLFLLFTAFNPLTIIIPLVFALGGALRDAYEHNETFRANVDKLIGVVMGLAELFKNDLEPVLSAVMGHGGNLFGVMVSGIEAAMPSVIEFTKHLGLMAHDAMPQIISIGQQIAPVILNFGGALLQLGQAVLPPILALFRAIAPIALMAFAGIGAILFGAVIPALTGLMHLLGPVIALWINLAAIFAGNLLGLLHGVGDAISWVSGFFSSMSRMMSPVVSGLDQIVGAAIQMIGTGGKLAVLGEGLGSVFGSLGTIGHFLAQVLMGIFSVVGGLLMPVFNALGPVLRIAAQALGVIFLGVVNVVVGALNILVGIVRLVFGFIADLVSGNFSKMGQHAMDALHQMVTGIIGILKGLVAILGGLLGGLLGMFIAAISGLVTGVIGWFVHLFNEIVGHSIIPDMVRGIINWIASLPGTILGLIIGLVVNFIANIMSLYQRVIALIVLLISTFIGLIQGGIGGIINAAAGIVTGILGAVQSLPGKMAEIGANLMNSLASAIKNTVGAPVKAIGDAAGGIIDNAKKFFHIGSPSQVFHDMGVNINEGMANGLDASATMAAAAASRSASKVSANYNPTAAIATTNRPGTSAAGSAANGETVINLYLQGGLGAGLQLLNPTDRRRFAMQIAQELGLRNNLQTNIGAGYTGN